MKYYSKNSSINHYSKNSRKIAQISKKWWYNGWNLENSFDGFDADLTETDTREEAWGNPIVSRELIHAVKEKGYDSISIPMTVHWGNADTIL